MKVLLKFGHGLGDAVQFTIVLKHIQKKRPKWKVDVLSGVGKHSCYYGLCNNTYAHNREIKKNKYDKIIDVRWYEWYEMGEIKRADLPATKVTKSLLRELNIDPDPELFGYDIKVQDNNRKLVKKYFDSLPPNKGVVPIHYEANTSSRAKNLTHTLIEKVCRALKQNDYQPIILDWDNRSPLPNGRTIFKPGQKHFLWNGNGTGDGNTLAAMIEASALFIGVDSGPLHVAGATDTPTIGMWREHHPLHFYDLCENETH